MRKSTLFISAALTTFILAVLTGVASAYQTFSNPQQNVSAQKSQQDTVEVSQQASPTLAPTAAPAQNVTPEEAAALASQVINRTDLYSIEMSTYNEQDAYLVTFSSGDLVYVGLDGQILSVGKVEVTVVTETTTRKKDRNKDDGGSAPTTNNQSSGEHEDHAELDD